MASTDGGARIGNINIVGIPSGYHFPREQAEAICSTKPPTLELERANVPGADAGGPGGPEAILLNSAQQAVRLCDFTFRQHSSQFV